MKVLQVLPALGSGGVERTTVDVARALVKAGHEEARSERGERPGKYSVPHVASAGGVLVAEITAMGGVHHDLPLASKNPLVWRKTAAALSAIIKHHDIDIVHARSRAPARPALWAARRTGAVFLTTYHGVYNAGNPLKRRYNSVMVRGQHIIANSEYTKAHIIAEHGVTAERISAVPRGVDLTRFTKDIPDNRIAAIRKFWGVDAGERVLLLPGRLTRWKGQDIAAKAMTGVKDLTLVIQGDAQGREHYHAELTALAQGPNLTNGARIIISPPHSDMPAAYAASFGALSASVEPEAFGRVTAEACAMGVPVIATAHGGSIEILNADTKPLGLMAIPGDVESLRAQMQRLSAMTPEQARAFARPAQARAREKFTNAAMCAATLAVYTKLLSK